LPQTGGPRAGRTGQLRLRWAVALGWKASASWTVVAGLPHRGNRAQLNFRIAEYCGVDRVNDA
jgi:hypothetical protein